MAIAGAGIGSANVPLVGNVDARLLTGADELRRELSEQVAQPVLWADSLQRMIEAGVTVFLEFGAGQVLTGLVQRLEGDLQAMAVGDASTAQAAVPWLAERAATGSRPPGRQAASSGTGADVAQESCPGKAPGAAPGRQGGPGHGRLRRHRGGHRPPPGGRRCARRLPLPQPGVGGPGHPGRHPRRRGRWPPRLGRRDLRGGRHGDGAADGGGRGREDRHPGQYRRHAAGQAPGAPGGGRLGHRPGHQPAQRLPRLPGRAAPHDAPALGAHRQHFVRGRPHRQRGAEQLLRGQGRPLRPHPGPGPGGGDQGDHGQRRGPRLYRRRPDHAPGGGHPLLGPGAGALGALRDAGRGGRPVRLPLPGGRRLHHGPGAQRGRRPLTWARTSPCRQRTPCTLRPTFSLERLRV